MWASMRIFNGGKEAQNIPVERIRIRKIIMSLTKAKVKISPKGNIRNIQKIRKQSIKIFLLESMQEMNQF